VLFICDARARRKEFADFFLSISRIVAAAAVVVVTTRTTGRP
jgi:hypothetical protein